jgi:hypothetical protein
MSKTTLIGSISYSILLHLSAFFYMERTVFIDMAYHIFYILKDDGFAIQNYRFVAAFTQFFPLLGSKMGMELESIARLYSLAFAILYFLIFLIIAFVLKLWRYALIMLLFSTLMVSHTFYWIQSEFPQGLAMMVLYFALLDYIDKKPESHKIWFLALGVLLFTVAFSHPLMIFPFAFFSLFLGINEAENRKLHVFSFLSFILFWGIKLVLFKSPYDSTSMGGVKNVLYLFPDYFTIQSNKDFIRYCISDYYMLIILWLGVMGFYTLKKEWKKLVLVGGFFMGYLMLVNISYYNGADQFYLENLYLPLSLFVALPLVMDVYEVLGERKFLYLVLVIVLFSLGRIYFTSYEYTQRLDYLNEILNEYRQADVDKAIIDENHVNMSLLKMSWATPYEFWLLSTIRYGQSISLVVLPNASQFHWALTYKDSFFTQWGVFEYSQMNPRYFIFDTEVGYILKE